MGFRRRQIYARMFGWADVADVADDRVCLCMRTCVVRGESYTKEEGGQCVCD